MYFIISEDGFFRLSWRISAVGSTLSKLWLFSKDFLIRSFLKHFYTGSSVLSSGANAFSASTIY